MRRTRIGLFEKAEWTAIVSTIVLPESGPRDRDVFINPDCIPGN
jgi:hypothetical protein